MLSQWSMSERDGYLRVATTLDEFRGKSRSRLTVLEQDGPGLVKTSSIGQLGPTERIHAVRFFDDIAYVVTFRQTDPLYAARPIRPQRARSVRGELKINGYSAYLHPVGEDLLLGVGQDADERGRTKGAQASLFDVSDLDDPSVLDQVGFGNSTSSSVEFDSKAFTFDPQTGLAIFPMVGYGPADGPDDRTGAVALPIEGDAPPASLGDATTLRAELEPGDSKRSRAFGYLEQLDRSVIVSGRVYSISNRAVVAHDLPGLNPQGTLELPRR